MVLVAKIDVAEGSVGIERLGGEGGGDNEDVEGAPADEELLRLTAHVEERPRADQGTKEHKGEHGGLKAAEIARAHAGLIANRAGDAAVHPLARRVLDVALAVARRVDRAARVKVALPITHDRAQ